MWQSITAKMLNWRPPGITITGPLAYDCDVVARGMP